MAYNVTTEWEDIHVKKGNFVPTMIKDDQHKEEIQNLDKYLETTETAKIEKEDDDDFFDDDYLEFEKQYKSKLIQRNYHLSALTTQNQIIQLMTMDDYQNNILNIKDDRLVFLILYKDSIQQSITFIKLITEYLFSNMQKNKLASSDLTVYKMISTDCLKNYEDKDVPSLLIFKKGIILQKYIQCFNYFINGSFTLNEIKAKELIDIVIKAKTFSEKYNDFKSNFENTYKYEDKVENETKLIKNDREYLWDK